MEEQTHQGILRSTRLFVHNHSSALTPRPAVIPSGSEESGWRVREQKGHRPDPSSRRFW